MSLKTGSRNTDSARLRPKTGTMLPKQALLRASVGMSDFEDSKVGTATPKCTKLRANVAGSGCTASGMGSLEPGREIERRDKEKLE